MLLFKPQINCKFCDFCHDSATIFFHFFAQKIYSLNDVAYIAAWALQIPRVSGSEAAKLSGLMVSDVLGSLA